MRAGAGPSRWPWPDRSPIPRHSRSPAASAHRPRSTRRWRLRRTEPGVRDPLPRRGVDGLAGRSAVAGLFRRLYPVRCGTRGTGLRLRAMVTGRREDHQGEPATAQESGLRFHQASPVRGRKRGWVGPGSCLPGPPTDPSNWPGSFRGRGHGDTDRRRGRPWGATLAIGRKKIDQNACWR
jgi:hypothetical protein